MIVYVTSNFIIFVTRNLFEKMRLDVTFPMVNKYLKNPKWRKVIAKLLVFQKGQFLINSTVIVLIRLIGSIELIELIVLIGFIRLIGLIGVHK